MDGNRTVFSNPIRLYLCAALVACTLAFAPSASAQTGAAMIAIDRMTLGSPPAGFSFARTGRGREGEWSVTADRTAAAGQAIEQTSTDRTDYRFPLAIRESLSAANVDVEIRFKAVAGKTDQAGGIAVRLMDADNYYVARANALEDNVRFYRVVGGRREQLEGANLKVTSNEWHRLGLRAEGRRFTVSYDGKPLFTATDATFAAAGGVALWTKSDSVTRFDQVAITVLP
jgi:glycosyl hydrolase family 59 (putative galactocerebrosidase)